MKDTYIYEVEKLIFWYLEAQRIRLLPISKKAPNSYKNFSCDDIAISIKRLYNLGKINNRHLFLIEKMIDKDYILKNDEEFFLWDDLLEKLYPQLKSKGILSW